MSDRGETIPQNTLKTMFIDLSQCASLVNRRFYRQGLNWAVSSMMLKTPVESSISIQKLPNTWVMSNAWEKGFRAWMQMNKEALEEVPSVKPKFLDFKIFADKHHHRLGYDANLLPVSYDYDDSTNTVTITTAVAGEWESSKLRIPVGPANPGDTHEKEVIAVGASYPGTGASGINAVSLIEGYAASRGLPNILDPNTPNDADDADGTTPENWISAMFNDGTEQTTAVLNDLITENNEAPYPFENGTNPAGGTFTDTMYPGGANQLPDLETHALESVTATTIGGMTHIPGGNFPCGLIGVNFTPTGNAATAILEIDLVPGTHRGYLAESMTEM